MMDYKEEDYLQLSGLQHFSFCRRQWALIHIETQWAENVRTVEGGILHETVHDPYFNEKRKDRLIVRNMPVYSAKLGISGACDVVEFHAHENGVTLFGREGTWQPFPVEYKRGVSKEIDADRLQLCAQAMCLEDMLLCQAIEVGYLYYGETRRREKVLLDASLREQTTDLLREMHALYARKYTPKVKTSKKCRACSIRDLCLPKLCGQNQTVKEYLKSKVEELP